MPLYPLANSDSALDQKVIEFGNALFWINETVLCYAQSVVGWDNPHGQVNHLAMQEPPRPTQRGHLSVDMSNQYWRWLWSLPEKKTSSSAYQ